MTELPSQPSEPPKPEYPDLNFPTIFADGIASASWDRGVVKFFLSRNSPDLRASAPGKDTPFMQVVMPTVGFVAMSLFFERIVSRLVAANHISQSDLEAMRQIWNPDHAS